MLQLYLIVDLCFEYLNNKAIRQERPATGRTARQSTLKHSPHLLKRAHQWILRWVGPFTKSFGLVLKLLSDVALYFRIRFSGEEPLHCPCEECLAGEQKF